MPQFEITVTLPESFQYPVEVQRAFTETLHLPVTKVVKVQPTIFPPDLNSFDHLFTDTQALVDAVRYDSTVSPQYAPKAVDQILHDSVVRLEGAVTQLKRALEEALRAVKS